MTRQEQVRLAALLAHQAMPKIIILAGDTNFYTSQGMAVPSVVGFIDVWKHLKPTEPGHTFGVTYSVKSSSRRINGIFQWPHPDVTPSSIEIFGGDGLGGSTKDFLSDHVGLTATFG